MAGDNTQAKNTVASLASELGFSPVDSGNARQARLLESMADFIRLIMIDGKMGPFTSISAHQLPVTTSANLGGRQASNFT